MARFRTDRVRTAGSDFLGHPRGLTFLFTTEMWERFSYYGMRALLVLYMVKYLLLPGHDDVIGLCAFRSALESLFGPLGVQPFASEIYGFYTGFVYLTPFFGGWLADRLLGQRRTVILGAVLMAAGHFMMAFEPLFLLALFTLILGNGAFKPNISTQVGGLYAPGDHRRDRAYSIFYVGISGRQFGDLAVAIRLFRRYHHGGALSLSHRLVAGIEDRTGAHGLDDDGPVARHQFHRQFYCRLAGWLLELHGQDQLLPSDRHHRGKRRHGDLVLQPSAQRYPAWLAPAF